MTFRKFIKHISFVLLTFLFGAQTSYAKTELSLPQNKIYFSIEQNQSFQRLEKEVQPNIGFLQEKFRFVMSEGVSAQNNCNFSECFVGSLANGGGSFSHIPTSGAVITSSAKQGTFLIGSYPTDLVHILDELNYPKINQIDLSFPVPQGQKFNLLNISDDLYQQYLNSGGGFFSQVNGPWIDAAVSQGRDIVVVSDFQQLYNAAGELTGFGKEVHRLEWIHGYRFDSNTKMMIPQNQGTSLPAKTLQSDYTHN